MNCPACGRALAAGARKCVFCGDGTKFRPREQISIPKGTVPERRGSSFPWGRVMFILILVGGVAAAFLHPGLNAWIRGLMSRF